MDVETVLWLLPWFGGVALGVIAVATGSRIWVAVAVTACLLWGTTWGLSQVSCEVEGFGDGPLPVQCRPTPVPEPNLGTGQSEPRPASLAAPPERTYTTAGVKPRPRLELHP